MLSLHYDAYTSPLFHPLTSSLVPAYKEIPFAATTTLTVLFTQYAFEVGFAYDRKEPKDHGEGGRMRGRCRVERQVERGVDEKILSRLVI